MTGFPDSFATPHLTAERLRPEHASDIHRMHIDPEQMALLGGVRDEVQTAAYMERNLEHWGRYGFGVWLLRDVRDGRLAGRALLRHVLVEETDEIEVGYSLFPAFWGRGLAAEAAGACLEHARKSLGVPSVVGLTLPANGRSQRVMVKIGMSFEREVLDHGVLHVLFRTRMSPAAGDAT